MWMEIYIQRSRIAQGVKKYLEKSQITTNLSKFSQMLSP